MIITVAPAGTDTTVSAFGDEFEVRVTSSLVVVELVVAVAGPAKISNNEQAKAHQIRVIFKRVCPTDFGEEFDTI